MDDLDILRPEVQKALHGLRKCVLRCEPSLDVGLAIIRAELLRLAGENARLNRIESLATEQRLQMEDVELYLMDVSQPDDEDAHWCDRMKSAIELLVQDCNYAVGQKNKSEAELAAVKSATCDWRHDLDEDTWDSACGERWMFEDGGPEENSVRFCHGCGKRVRLVVEE